ncbi:hypothetical protein DFJ73DRAFT_28070 [Zopfochytrium polystomum]|nr:hypothetical protein DFJ73DRAFT_28070 [Zopfochytrium polystomum]
MALPELEWQVLSSVPGLGLNCEGSVTLSPAECSLRLASVLSEASERLRGRGVRTVLVWDDVQWLDQVSFGTLVLMMRWCPSTLFLLGGRPREEWGNPSSFDVITSSENLRLIPLHPLTLEDVRSLVRNRMLTDDADDRLVNEVFRKSQGVPVAIEMMLNLEIAKTTQRISRKTRGRGMTERAGAGLDGTISAQLDALPVNFRHLLTVAAVSGQYFDLETLAGVYRILEPSEFGSPKRLMQVIQTDDKFGFLKLLDSETMSFSFCHYLIHQGVLATLLPSTKEVFNRALIAYYEQKLTTGDPSLVLPCIIRHLMEVNGEREKKARYLFDGFVSAAEMSKTEEAMSYSRQLAKLDAKYEDSLPLTVKIKFLHLLGVVHKASGDATSAKMFCVKACAEAGYQIPLSHRQFGRFVAHTFLLNRFVVSLRTAPDMPRACMARLAKTFKRAFPRWRKSSKTSARVAPALEPPPPVPAAPAGQLTLTDSERATLEQLINVIELMFQVAFTSKGGLDILLLLQLLIVLYAPSNRFVAWRTKYAYFLAGFAHHVVGIPGGQYFFDVADAITDEPACLREEMYRYQVLMLEQIQFNLCGNQPTLSSLQKCAAAVRMTSSVGKEFDTSVKVAWLLLLSALQE